MTSGTHPTRSRERQWLVRLVPGLIVLALFVVFAVENGRTVRVRFLFWQVNTSLSWALLVAGLLGLILGLMLPWLRRFFRSRTSR